MGISLNQLETAIEFVKNKISNLSHDKLIERDKQDSHPISAITGLSDAVEKAEKISIAQKTVTEEMSKELLDDPVLFVISKATNDGTNVYTNVNKNVVLNDSIKNYDMLFFQYIIEADNTFPYTVENNSYFTDTITFHNSETTPDNLSNFSRIMIWSTIDLRSGAVGNGGTSAMSPSFWFKTDKQIFVNTISNGLSNCGRLKLTSIKGVKTKVKTIDPLNYVNTSQGIEDTPVGNVISYMGKIPPKHYLACDGSIYNITEYPYLAQFIKDEHETFNFFGGDGITTFAVPDLRGEFLRGTGTSTRNTGSGANVGVHQDGTTAPWIGTYNAGSSTQFMTYYSKTGADFATNTDKVNSNAIARAVVNSTIDTSAGVVGGGSSYTTRPTNTSVLYCIKFEPTYFMSIQGMIEETVLWEGETTFAGKNVHSGRIEITLNDSFDNYDKIGVFFTALYSGVFSSNNKRRCYSEIPKYNLEKTMTNETIEVSWGYNDANHIDTLSLYKNNNDSSFGINTYNTVLTRIIGIKYKTFQGDGNNSGGNGCECETYTDEEITNMMEDIINGHKQEST